MKKAIFLKPPPHPTGISEFDLPPEIIDRRVRKMKMISPSNREVDVNNL